MPKIPVGVMKFEFQGCMESRAHQHMYVISFFPIEWEAETGESVEAHRPGSLYCCCINKNNNNNK